MAEHPYIAPPPHENPPAAVRLLKELLARQGYWTGTIGNDWGARLTEAVVYFQQTHIDRNGRSLDADGKVGDETWWALENASGAPQRSGLKPSIPSGLSAKRVALLEAALAEHALDVKEEPNGSNRGPQVDKYFPDWLLKKFGPSGKGEAWCAFFFNWVTKKALGSTPWGGYIGSCYSLLMAAKKSELAVYIDPHLIQPGDAFLLFSDDPDHGRPDRGHIGMVLRVSEDCSEINTVEGNCGNRVKVGMRPTSGVRRFINTCDDGFVGAKTFERGLVDAPRVTSAATR